MNSSKIIMIYWLLIVAMLVSSCKEPEEPAIRILTGGIRHESNTFVSVLTQEGDFTQLRGSDVLKQAQWAEHFAGTNIEIIPTLHAYARPYGVVSMEAFEKFMNEIIEGAENAGRIDGVFLDMHGALHAEGYDDAQAYFVSALRQVVGDDVLISGSFDLHGNMSKDFVSRLDILTAYRTAPHIDAVETRIRAMELLIDAIKNDYKPVIAHIPVPLLIPGEKGITFTEPLKSIYERLPGIAEKEGLMDASIFIGCAWSDLYRTSITVQVVAKDSSYLELAENEAESLAVTLWDARDELDFEVPVAEIDDAIKMALDHYPETVYISDSGDNTTAGAAGDVPLVLEKLIEKGVDDAIVAGITDRDAVRTCKAAGAGAVVQLTVGGKIDKVFGQPFSFEGTVKKVVRTSYNDTAAIVQAGGISVVLLSQRRSFTRINDFEELGIDPLGHQIVVVKLGYLFPELREIAPHAIMALTPGTAYQVIENLPYLNIRRPVYPLDPEMTWQPQFD